MRKKLILFSVLIVLGVAVILILTMQPDTGFDGERVSDQRSFALRFDWMNMTNSETLDLREGDTLHVFWQIKSGYVDIVVRQKNEEPVYQANGSAAGIKPISAWRSRKQEHTQSRFLHGRQRDKYRF